MGLSPEMSQAILELQRILPPGLVIDHKADKPLYTLIKVDGWPYAVHYEFRSNRTSALFVELHIEHERYAFLGETFHQCSREVPSIRGFAVEYHESRDGPIRKKWPSLSVQLPPGVSGILSAKVMLEMITATRETLTRALGF